MTTLTLTVPATDESGIELSGTENNVPSNVDPGTFFFCVCASKEAHQDVSNIFFH